MNLLAKLISYILLIVIISAPLPAAEELNVYSARKEALIKPLLDQFAEANNIKVNLITSKDDALIQRLIKEGKNTPADVLITVDVGRLFRAKQAGQFQPLDVKKFSAYAPSQFQDPEGYWFGLSVRVRTIVYNPEKTNETLLAKNPDFLTDQKE